MALIDVNGKRFKNFMTKLYGLGAAVVIMGALFKILHLPFADLMLIVGLTTEAVIFAISAFEAPAKEYDWSLVYPEFEGGESSGKGNRRGVRAPATQRGDPTLGRNALKTCHDRDLEAFLELGIKVFTRD